MLELGEIARVFSGIAVQETADGTARFMRLSDLSDLKAGRHPGLVLGHPPVVARALAIEDDDLIVGARGQATDVCMAERSIHGAFISLDLYLVRPDRALVHPGYLAAFLDLPATQAVFAGSKQGSGLARLPKEALETVSVPIPPMPRQRSIAALARAVRDETRLLGRLAELRITLGRAAIARAIGTADDRPKS